MAFPEIPELHRDPTTDPGRISRMSAELEQGFQQMHGVHKAVSFFGSARTPHYHPEYIQALEVAKALGQDGWTMITGGGPGIMEAANRGAQAGGALSVGLNIDLNFEPEPNPYQDLELHFHYFFARKVMFVRYASAFIAAPGGFGTLDEIFEALTLVQTQKIDPFPVVFLGKDYWSGMIDWMRDKMLAGGKINPEDLELLVTDDVDEIKALLANYKPRPRRDV